MPLICPRDERGWRVPRPGTQSWETYHLVIDGWTSGEIIDLYGEDRYSSSVRVQINRIKNPTKHNAAGATWRARHYDKARASEQQSQRKRKRKRTTQGLRSKDSYYVRKLVNILGMTGDQARAEEARQLSPRKRA